MEKKITKKQVFEALIGAVTGMEKVGEIDAAVVLATLETAVAQLDAKAGKAKAKAAEKKAEGDALRAEIAGVLTDEFQTADEITAQVETEGVTKAKVVARLTQLVDAEVAVKEQVKVGDRKLMAYKIKPETEETVDGEPVDEVVDAE